MSAVSWPSHRVTQNFPPGTVRPLSPLCLHNEKGCPLHHPEKNKWGQTFKISLYPTVQAAQGGRKQTQRSSDSRQRLSFLFPRALCGVTTSDTTSHSTTGGAERLSVPGNAERGSFQPQASFLAPGSRPSSAQLRSQQRFPSVSKALCSPSGDSSSWCGQEHIVGKVYGAV